LQKQKKLVNSLKTLEKIENAAIQKLQPELTRINALIENIDLKVGDLTSKIDREKEFLKENNGLDYIEFFARVSQEIKTLNSEKDNLLNEFDEIYERMMVHVLKEKAYTSIKNKNIKSIKKDLEKKEEENIADIVSMRYFFNEK
jgi:hypothetical protein